MTVFSDFIPGIGIGCLHMGKRVPWWDYLLCSSCSAVWNTLIIFSVDLRIFFGMAKLHNPALLAGNWWLCKRKKSHDCKNCQLPGSPAARIAKFWIRTLCSGLSIDRLCSYLQLSSSSVCFYFHSCPAVPSSFSLPATFMP